VVRASSLPIITGCYSFLLCAGNRTDKAFSIFDLRLHQAGCSNRKSKIKNQKSKSPEVLLLVLRPGEAVGKLSAGKQQQP